MAFLELFRVQGATPPIPFLLVYASVVLASVVGGRATGMLASGVACLFILASWDQGIGPPSLTGGLPQMGLGMVLHIGTAWLVGSARDRATQHTEDLEGMVSRRTAQLQASHQALEAEMVTRARRDQERRELQERVQQGQRLESLGVLAGGIAHDFNNLLTGITGNAALLEPHVASGSEEHRMLLDIQAAAARSAELIAQMLAYAGRAPRGEPENVDLCGVVQEMAALLRASIPKSTTLRVELCEVPVGVSGDETQLAQIVMNLVTNGAEAAGEGGTVSVRCEVRSRDAVEPERLLGNLAADHDRYSVLSVSDDGVGMSDEQLRLVFEPFYSTKQGGRGLGLAVVFGVARTHHGGLGITSTPGEGTTFEVVFPWVAPAPLEEGRGRDAERIEPDERLILVVDDEPAVREVLRLTLVRAGYTVVLAEDGTHGWSMFEAHRARLGGVIADLSMPGLDGRTLLRRIREAEPTLSMCLMTGYSAEPAGVEGVKVIHKPFRPDVVLAAFPSET